MSIGPYSTQTINIPFFRQKKVETFQTISAITLNRLHNVWKLLKMSHFNLEFLITFCLIKSDLSGSTVWPQALGFPKLAKIERFGTFYELLSTQNVNIARFARNVECDYFYKNIHNLCNFPLIIVLSGNTVWPINAPFLAF